MDKHDGKRSLVQEGDESQRTKEGLDIPVPKTEDFNRLLRKSARKRSQDEDASRSGEAKQ